MDAQVRPEGPADDRGVLDALVVAQDRLDILGVYLLSIGQREHVLLAAAEREHAVGRESTKVASVVPAVGIDRGGGGLGVLPVAGEAPRPTGQDLPVFGDPGLDAGDRLAHRPDDIPFRAGEADDGTHLGRAVALQDVDAHLRPALGDLQVEGRRPHADRVEPATELAEHGPEQQAAQPARSPARKSVRLLEAGAPARLVDLPLDRRVQEPQALRDDQQDRYLEVAKRADQHSGLAADRVHDAGTDDQRAHEPEHLFIEVRERQHGQEAVPLVEREHLGHRGGAGHEVAVAEHRALRLTGGPAREHDLRERGARHRCRWQGRCPPGPIRERLDPHDRQAELACRRLGLTTRDDQPGPGLGDDLATEVDRVADVERDRDPARVGDCQERDPPLGPVDGPHDGTVAFGQALVGEDARRARHDRPEVAVAPGPRPEERTDHERGSPVEPRCSRSDQVDQGLHDRSTCS